MGATAADGLGLTGRLCSGLACAHCRHAACRVEARAGGVFGKDPSRGLRARAVPPAPRWKPWGLSLRLRLRLRLSRDEARRGVFCEGQGNGAVRELRRGAVRPRQLDVDALHALPRRLHLAATFHGLRAALTSSGGAKKRALVLKSRYQNLESRGCSFPFWFWFWFR